MCVSVCKCDECSFFNYCINMDFESVNKDLLLFKHLKFISFHIMLYRHLYVRLLYGLHCNNIKYTTKYYVYR